MALFGFAGGASDLHHCDSIVFSLFIETGLRNLPCEL